MHPAFELKGRVPRDPFESPRERRHITKSTTFSKLNDRLICRMEHRGCVSHAHEVNPVLEGHTCLLMKESRKVRSRHRSKGCGFSNGNRGPRVFRPMGENAIQRRIVSECVPLDIAVFEFLSLLAKFWIRHGIAR